MNKQTEEITIKELIDIFLPKIWLLAIVAIIFAAAAGVYSLAQPNTYTSQAKYVINKTNLNDSNLSTGLNTSEVDAIGVMINNLEELIATTDFANKVIDKIKEDNLWQGELNVKQIINMIQINRVSDDTTCYYLSVTSEDPQLSKAVADVAGDISVSEYEVTHKYAIFISRIDHAETPASRDSKHVVRNAFIGGVIGGVLAMLVVFVVAKLDVVVRSKEKLEQAYDIPVIGSIPSFDND